MAQAPKPAASESNASGSAGGVVICAIDWATQRAALAELFMEFYGFLRDEHGFDALAIMDDAAALPGPYAAPEGEAFLALVDGIPAGCFCLRPYPSYSNGARTAEAKRMYVRPGFRGLRLGSQLLDAVLEAARSRGYDEILLDSLLTLPDAHRLYYKRGFTVIPQYNDLPASLVLHMRLPLR